MVFYTPLLIGVALQSSSMRNRVNGAIAIRWPKSIVPSLTGLNSRDILAYLLFQNEFSLISKER